MLILTGGLVLGETMALWMTAKEEWFGLAAVLLVFACGKTAADSRAWKGRCMAPALLFLFGLTAGMMRMEWEEKAFEKESVIYPQNAAEVIGEISEIGATLTLKLERKLRGSCHIPKTPISPSTQDKSQCLSRGEARDSFTDAEKRTSREWST